MIEDPFYSIEENFCVVRIHNKWGIRSATKRWVLPVRKYKKQYSERNLYDLECIDLGPKIYRFLGVK